MDSIKKAYYRTFQAVFNVGARLLYWRKPITVTGENTLATVPELFKKHNVKKVMIVTGRTVGRTIAPIAKEALDKAGIAYEHYSDVAANPTVKVVNEIQKMYLDTGCEGFLAIGGGSPMDCRQRRNRLGDYYRGGHNRSGDASQVRAHGSVPCSQICHP